MIRDPKSKAVLNNDVQGLNKYKAEKKYRKKVDHLENEVVEIQQIVERMCNKIEELEKLEKNKKDG